MDKISYALGMSITHNLMHSGVKTIETGDFLQAMQDVLAGGETQMSGDEVNQILNEYFTGVREEETQKLKEVNQKFLDENKTKDGVQVTESGLQYKVINKGSGKKPGATSKVKVHYEGKFINGQKFDSSYDRKEAIEFGLNQVIPGWTEGLQLMSEGSKYELYIPYQLGYGESGAANTIPPFSTLVFTVELLEVLN